MVQQYLVSSWLLLALQVIVVKVASFVRGPVFNHENHIKFCAPQKITRYTVYKCSSSALINTPRAKPSHCVTIPDRFFSGACNGILDKPTYSMDTRTQHTGMDTRTQHTGVDMHSISITDE